MTKEQQILHKLKELYAYDLDKVLKNYMRKSANEVKNKYKSELVGDERTEAIKFIDGATELMSNDIIKLIKEYLDKFENNL